MQLNFIRNTDNFLTLLKQIHIENIKLSPSYQKKTHQKPKQAKTKTKTKQKKYTKKKKKRKTQLEKHEVIYSISTK